MLAVCSRINFKKRRCFLKCLAGVIIGTLLLILKHHLSYTNKKFERDPDCRALLAGDPDEIRYAQLYQTQVKMPIKYNMYPKTSGDCSKFLLTRTYPTSPSSKEEADFPLAYSIVVHNNFEQFEHLLRSIYHPQNAYCIHMDAKSPEDFQAAVTAISRCFDNVFLASRQLPVVYGSYNRLLADVNCMTDLLQMPQQWKYVLNVCGQELPLATNLEMVRALTSLNGTNDIVGVVPYARHFFDRFKYVYKPVRGVRHDYSYHMEATNLVKDPAPHNITVLFGTAYNLLTRAFVEYVIHDKVPQDLLEWFRDTYSPDEHFWATLQYLPDSPGGKSKKDMGWNSKARAVKWREHSPHMYPFCQGTYQRDICIYGVGDLNWLTLQKKLIANKFDLNKDYLVVTCIEQWLKYKIEREKNTKINGKKRFMIKLVT